MCVCVCVCLVDVCASVFVSMIRYGDAECFQILSVFLNSDFFLEFV